MTDTLCWKCREDFDRRCHDYGLDGYFANHFLHCHHEPKEKKKCWCEGDMGLVQIKVDQRESVWHRATYCPECGKKLCPTYPAG